MRKRAVAILELLDRLEAHYGPQEVSWPADPYEFIVWWNSGYPQSDAACTKGWHGLASEIGMAPSRILAAPPAKLAAAVKSGGMIPELRALRLKEIARRVQGEFGGDLRSALAGPLANSRKVLKKFPGIADPGADRILLFSGIAPIAAVPSNGVHVPVRILRGQEGKNYRADYLYAQESLAAELPASFDTRRRAYLLLKRHGQELCKRNKPKCDLCPVKPYCAFINATRRA